MSQLIVIKTRRDKRFSTINLTAIEDKQLSWGSKGLHGYLITRPPNWKVRFKDLLNHASDKDSSLKNKLKELQAGGYLSISRTSNRNAGKFAGSTWEVYEQPQQVLISEWQKAVSRKTAIRHHVAENGQTEKPHVEKPSDGKSTDLINTIPNKYLVTTHQEVDPHTREGICAPSRMLSIFQEIAGWLPEDLQMRELIESFVERTTPARMKEALGAWKWKGYRVENLEWLSDWAVDGIPKHIRKDQPRVPNVTAESQEVMDYLNMKYCTRYTALSYHQLISQLIRAGYTVDVIKTTIDHRYSELELESTVEKWFKPGILFRLENFEGYFNSVYTTTWKPKRQ